MIGVIGGTGNTGRAVVAALKAKGADFRCLVRDKAKAAETLGSDVELAKADTADAASIEAGLAGCDTLFLLTGHSPVMGEQQINTIEAAKRAGVTYIVKVSGGDAVARPDSPSKIGQAHYHVEEALKASGVDWAILRPGLFMQNFLNMAGTVKAQGKIFMPVPAAAAAGLIDVRDTGDVAAEVLTNPDAHKGKTYFLAGALRTPADVAAALSAELGKEVAFVEVPIEGALAAMKERGMPGWLVDHMAAVMGLHASGEFAQTSDLIEQISGHAPRTLEQFVHDYAGVFSG